MKQYTLLTANGINKLLKTASNGSKITLKEVVVSDFDGELSESITTIPNEKYRGAINAITINESDSNILDVDAVIPPEVGGFYIKTAGIFCDDGSLFAVARLADTYKPLLSEGSSKDITLSFRLQIANANDSIVLKVDNNVVLATRKWSDATFLKKIDAYTKQESDSKFLKIGDYGLGGYVPPFISNLDDTTTLTGFYRAVENQTTGTFPQPYGGSRHAHVLVERLDLNWIKQTIVQISQDETKPIFYRTNNLGRGWHPWKEVITADRYNLDMLKEATSNSHGNTLVKRDANGDFAGRYISASHFKLMTQQQNNLFGESSEILFRGGASEDTNYVRAVSGTYMLKALLGARGDGIFFQGVNENKGERGQATFGYVRLPGGVLLQFGISHRMNPGETREQYFPVAFPTHCLCVLVSAHMPIPNDGTRAAQTNSHDNAKFVMQNCDANSSIHIFWMAIGA